MKADGQENAARTGTVGIVLAAGQSRRFGPENKLLAELRGRPLASYSAEAMRAAPFEHRIAVFSDPTVGGLFEDFIPVRVAAGVPQSESLKAGVTKALVLSPERIVVTLADMPLVTASLLDAVDARCAALGAAASTDGQRRSPPAGFDGRHFPALLSMTGDKGAADLIRRLPSEALVHADGLLADVDTGSDLADILTSHRAG